MDEEAEIVAEGIRLHLARLQRNRADLSRKNTRYYSQLSVIRYMCILSKDCNRFSGYLYVEDMALA
ncbi:hypothetical protein PT974_10038 [Cladobotryum mycophilum]|uniref:Uncharacterized protein n=1 Tax=Cladobotryum mycophilum TaxID=491253 RepID=A0ABR0S8Q4_9HYPO